MSSPLTNRASSTIRGAPQRPRASQIAAVRHATEETTDETLLALICSGDNEAFACLFHRYVRLVRAVAERILRNAAEAEDLAQDLFLFIQRKCVMFDSSKSSARSWIVQMTYHRAIERRRYLSTRHFYAGQSLEGAVGQTVGIPTTECDYSAETVFGRNGLEKVIAALSGDQKETLRLHFFEGYTFSEISAKMEQSLGNVRHHYYRALEKLREQMFDEDTRNR